MTASRDPLRLWLRLYRSVSLIERELKSRFSREFGVSLSRFDVMSALDRSADGLTMSELSERLLVTNGNVTGLISRLADDEMVERRPLPGDRRSVRVFLTDRGRAAFAGMADAHQSWIADILNGFPDEEAAQLSNQLDCMMAAARLDNQETAS